MPHRRGTPFGGTAIRTYSGSDHPPINVAADLDGPAPSYTVTYSNEGTGAAFHVLRT